MTTQAQRVAGRLLVSGGTAQSAETRLCAPLSRTSRRPAMAAAGRFNHTAGKGHRTIPAPKT